MTKVELTPVHVQVKERTGFLLFSVFDQIKRAKIHECSSMFTWELLTMLHKPLPRLRGPEPTRVQFSLEV